MLQLPILNPSAGCLNSPALVGCCEFDITIGDSRDRRISSSPISRIISTILPCDYGVVRRKLQTLYEMLLEQDYLIQFDSRSLLFVLLSMKRDVSPPLAPCSWKCSVEGQEFDSGVMKGD